MQNFNRERNLEALEWIHCHAPNLFEKKMVVISVQREGGEETVTTKANKKNSKEESIINNQPN